MELDGLFHLSSSVGCNFILCYATVASCVRDLRIRVASECYTNDLKVNNEIQPITQEHETFKQEIRAKLISMRNQRHSISLPSVNNAPICASSFVDDSNRSISSGTTSHQWYLFQLRPE